MCALAAAAAAAAAEVVGVVERESKDSVMRCRVACFISIAAMRVLMVRTLLTRAWKADSS